MMCYAATLVVISITNCYIRFTLLTYLLVYLSNGIACLMTEHIISVF